MLLAIRQSMILVVKVSKRRNYVYRCNHYILFIDYHHLHMYYALVVAAFMHNRRGHRCANGPKEILSIITRLGLAITASPKRFIN